MPDDDFMKSLGYPGGGKIATPEAEPSRPSAAPSDADLDWQQRAGKGVAKSLAGTVTGIPRAINAGIGLMSPALRQKLGDLAEQIPGVTRMEEFAQEPVLPGRGGSWAETGGYLGGEVAQLWGGPAAWQAAGKEIPGVFKAGEGFISNRPPPSLLQRGATAAAGGAAAGAMADPEDPGAGALVGAGAAGLGPGLGALAGTKGGQYLAGHAPRFLARSTLVAVSRLLGIPLDLVYLSGLPELVSRWHSPVARKIAGAGKGAAAKAAPWLKSTDPRAAGSLGGLAEGAVEGYVPKQYGPAVEETNGQADQSEEPARP